MEGIMKTIGRTLWGNQFSACWLCGRRTTFGRQLETHEIARGIHRSKAVCTPATWMRVCRQCHDTLGSMSIAAQLALKKINDPEWYDRIVVNRIRGRADEAITENEVDEEVRRLI